VRAARAIGTSIVPPWLDTRENAGIGWRGMVTSLRALARRLLGVERTPTYYLPWVTRPGLTCALLLSNVEARFKSGYTRGPFPVTVRQHDADGALVRVYDVVLRTSTDAVEVPLQPTAAGVGFATVDGARLLSDLYVTVSDGRAYTATHGRQEFVERYPPRSRALLGLAGALLGLAGRTVPAFARDQYAYLGAESRAHVLLLNLSNVTNRIRVAAEGDPGAARLVAIPPMGARLLDVGALLGPAAAGTRVRRLRLAGNAWFNLYLVGAGVRDLAGPLSLMHVK
jgi:hypothetical protein